MKSALSSMAMEVNAWWSASASIKTSLNAWVKNLCFCRWALFVCWAMPSTFSTQFNNSVLAFPSSLHGLKVSQRSELGASHLSVHQALGFLGSQEYVAAFQTFVPHHVSFLRLSSLAYWLAIFCPSCYPCPDRSEFDIYL